MKTWINELYQAAKERVELLDTAIEQGEFTDALFVSLARLKDAIKPFQVP